MRPAGNTRQRALTVPPPLTGRRQYSEGKYFQLKCLNKAPMPSAGVSTLTGIPVNACPPFHLALPNTSRK